MKNSIWLGIALVLVVVVLLLLGSKQEQAGNTNNTNSTSTTETSTKTAITTTKPKTPAPAPGMKVSLGGIFAEQGNYQCDYEKVTQDSRSSSVIYVSNGRMRGEFRTSAGLNSTATLLVYDGSYLYVWTEGKSTGVRTQPKTIADLPSLIPEDVSSGRILGSGINNVSWNCHAWSKDESKLVKPSYVTFY